MFIMQEVYHVKEEFVLLCCKYNNLTYLICLQLQLFVILESAQ